MERNKDGTLHAHSHAYQKALIQPRWRGTKAEVDEYYRRILDNAIGDLKYYQRDFARYYGVQALDVAIAALGVVLGVGE